MMAMRYEAASISEVFPTILSDLIEFGDEVGSRNGRVHELLNPQITLTSPQKREVLNPGRGANIFAQVAETMWVLHGRNDVEWLSAYLPRAKDYSDDGKTWRGGYGPRLRGGGQGRYEDQLRMVFDLLKRDPLSRRAVIGIYDLVDDAGVDSKDIPCNTFLQFQNRGGALHLTVTVRSNDVMWGWSGINAFEWSTVQEVMASLLKIGVGHLTFNIGNLHLYETHFAKAGRIERMPNTRLGFTQIPFNQTGGIKDFDDLDQSLEEWFEFEQKCRAGSVKYTDLADIQDPMFKAWAAVVAYGWTLDEYWMSHVRGTALWFAVMGTPDSVYPKLAGPTVDRGSVEAFLKETQELHKAKHEAYGDSWKKRGELISILPNIARKVDRMGADDHIESSADTLTDLWVYLVKYYLWLENTRDEFHVSDVDLMLDDTLHAGVHMAGKSWGEDWQDTIKSELNEYIDNVEGIDKDTKIRTVWALARKAAVLAYDQWYVENEYRGADAD